MVECMKEIVRCLYLFWRKEKKIFKREKKLNLFVFKKWVSNVYMDDRGGINLIFFKSFINL